MTCNKRGDLGQGGPTRFSRDLSGSASSLGLYALQGEARRGFAVDRGGLRMPSRFLGQLLDLGGLRNDPLQPAALAGHLVDE